MSKTILWVEDDYYNYQGLVKPLIQQGINVDYALTAAQAYQKILIGHVPKTQYNLVIVDIILPIGIVSDELPNIVASWENEPYPGIGIVKWLKREIKIDCPVLILSVIQDPIEAYGLETLGIDEAISKRGLMPSALSECVLRHLNKRDA